MAWRFTAVALTSPADLPKCSLEHLPYRDWTFDGEELNFVVPSGTEMFIADKHANSCGSAA
jgi:hypothetical protein